jgi:flagellar basal-body rod modification protein FlgD
MSTPAIGSNSTSTQPPTSSQSLNQADFLKLLVTQMTSQDPLNPQSDTAFAAQLAQFSALQQTTTMSGNIQGLQANTLIGRTVSVAAADNSGNSTTGVVSGIEFDSGTPEVLVNGQPYGISQITSILPTATTATPTP